MVKILNVMDEHSNFKSLVNGEYESGYWWRPDNDCTIIRLFGNDKGPSFLGGTIHGKRISEKQRTIFSFKDDPAQHGKPRPHHFKHNGCLATDE
jgi:hypothetical protein